jgi:hypothetical protein
MPSAVVSIGGYNMIGLVVEGMGFVFMSERD